MRISKLAGAVAALLFLSSAPAALSHSGGGGGHTVVIVTGVPGAAAMPMFRGDEAAMALEITDAPPTGMAGEAKLDDVIAVHQVRSSDAIILLDPAKGRRRTIPAGTALVRINFFPDKPGVTVWCDMRPTHRPLWPQEQDCFQDTANNGHLDKLWEGDTQVQFLGFSRSGVGAYGDPVPTPAAYRPAKPEERPTATLGFKYCDGDGVSAPPRFALTLTTSDANGWLLTGDCRFGVWPDASDKSKVDVDGLALTVTPAAAGVLRYQVTNRLPPEQLDRIEPYLDLRAAPDPQTLAAERLARVKWLSQAMLKPVGEAPKVNWGTAAVGQTLLTVPVKHVITGVLRNQIRAKGLLAPSGTVLQVGQPVFGVPTPNAGGEGMTWCAPVQKPTGYETTCLAPMTPNSLSFNSGYYWNGNRTPAMAPNAALLGFYSSNGGASSDPTVQQGPVNLPPMVLSLRFSEITMDKAGVPARVYHIEMCLDWGEGPQVVGRQTYELPPEGRRVQLLGASMLLKAGADPDQLLVTPAT